MSADYPLSKNQGDQSYYLSAKELSARDSPYCEECKNMIQEWPWAEIQHHAAAAMQLENCPLCKFIHDTLSLEKRIYYWNRNKLVTLHSWADEGDSHAHIAPLRRPITDITNPDTVRGAKKMLQDCSANHSLCRKLFGDFLTEQAELPKRVLELDQKNGFIRIYESKPSEKGVYATLSYVSGVEDQPIQATKEMMKQASSNNNKGPWIAKKKLPQAFQDAIEFTSGLGIKFLWIDVVCVVQDDPEDYKNAVLGFVSIYKNAAVCIRPANIDSIHQSFLSKKGPHLQYDACTIHVTGLKGKDITLKVTSKDCGPSNGMERHDGPLLNRAWPIAEAFASPRHLTITCHNEITYYCVHQKHTRGYPYIWAGTINESLNKYHYCGHQGLAWQMEYPILHNRRYYWNVQMNNILRAKLYRPTDRLAMVESIAHDPAWRGDPTWTGEYMYGFWKQDARNNLLWELVGGKPIKNMLQTTQRLNQAPTWSWASTAAKTSNIHSDYMVNWQMQFIDWVKGFPPELTPLDRPVLATICLKGKVVSREQLISNCGNEQLFLLASEVDCEEEFSRTEMEKWFILLVGQVSFGVDNEGDAMANAGTTKSAESNNATKQADFVQPIAPMRPRSIPQPFNPEEATLATFIPDTRHKRGFSEWISGFPKAISTRKDRILSIRQRLPGRAPRGEQRAHTVTETIYPPHQANYAQSPQDVSKSDGDALPDVPISVNQGASQVEEGPQKVEAVPEAKDESAQIEDLRDEPEEDSEEDSEGIFVIGKDRFKVQELIPEKLVKMMFLRHVSHNVYERVALVSRTFRPNWASFWNGVKLEDHYLI